MKTKRPRIGLDIAIYREQDWVVAKCLQLGVVTSGESNTIKQIREDIRACCVAQIDFAIENDLLDQVFYFREHVFGNPEGGAE